MCENGLVSLNHSCENITDIDESNVPLIVGFLGDIIFNEAEPTTAIYFEERELNDTEGNGGYAFKEAHFRVMSNLQAGFNESLSGFNATHIFHATWSGIKSSNPETVSNSIPGELPMVGTKCK